MICGEKKKGYEVEEDFVIKGVRWFKKNITKNEKGNKLVVCNKCYPKYVEYRDKFIRRQRIYLLLGFLFLLLGLLAAPSLSSLLFGLGIIFFLYLLSLINYVPKIREKRKE